MSVDCYGDFSCAICRDGLYYWPSFRKGNHDKKKGKLVTTPTKVNTLCYLSFDASAIVCGDGFTAVLSTTGQLFGFYYFVTAECVMTSVARSIFPATALPGCLYELLPGIVCGNENVKMDINQSDG